MAFCTRCGTPRPAATWTCANCGQQFSSPADPPLSAPPTATIAPQAGPFAPPPEASSDEPYPVYEESQPTTWDYDLPPGQGAAGPQPGGWGYYEEPQRQVPDQADPFWESFTGPGPDPAHGPTGASPSYPPPAAAAGPRQPASHRLVAARPAVRGRPGLQASLIAATVLLVLACGGGAYAIVASLTGHNGARSGTSASGEATSPAAQSAPLTPSASPAGASQTGGASPTPSATPAPSGTAGSSVPPATESAAAGGSTTAPAGSAAAPSAVTVAVSPAAQADSAEPAVARWLAAYFSAINSHDYQAYTSLLNAQEAADESQSDFDSGYGTTTDSAATLTSISDLGGGSEAADVSFTSHQSPAQSVDDSSCDTWAITIYLEPSGSSYAEVPPPGGYHSSYESC